MAMNPLPPQAYTKDTLQKAYSWLVTQDQQIQDMASTADVLVSLYLKATRDGESVLQRPSIQNFKNELKHLAPMMEEFDNNGHTSPVAQQAPPYHAPPYQAPAHQFHIQHAPPPSAPNGGSSINIPTGTNPIKQKIENESSHLLLQLDEKTLKFVEDVKEAANLSSDVEVVRMLIKIGYSKAMEFFSSK